MKYTSAFLTGGSNAEDTAATWAALTTTGKFTISIDGTEYADITPDFTGDTTMAEVATSIQAAIQTATGSTETVVWSTDHFVISSVDRTYESAITVASTPGSGVDLSTPTYMDCDSTNAVVTQISASNGMDVEDVYKAVAREVFDDEDDTTLDKNLFRRWINDGNRDVLKHITDIAPNWFLKESASFIITFVSTNQEYEFDMEDDLEITDCVTIERIDYIPDNSTYDDETLPIEMTEYDEKIDKFVRRWYRKADKIVFRGIEKTVNDVVVHYSSRQDSLIADSDRPSFPTNDYDSILVDYAIYRYYKKENLETNYAPYKDEYERRLRDIVDFVKPTDEPMTIDPTVEDGISEDFPYYPYDI